MMFERYSFVAITTSDLDRVRQFGSTRLAFRLRKKRRDTFSLLMQGVYDSVSIWPMMIFTKREALIPPYA